jgi:hypothetical protein
LKEFRFNRGNFCPCEEKKKYFLRGSAHASGSPSIPVERYRALKGETVSRPVMDGGPDPYIEYPVFPL